MRRTLWLAGILSICIGNALAEFDPDSYLRYEEFLDEVSAGNIISVDIDRYSQIKGKRRVGGEEKDFHAYGDVGNANDPLLIKALRDAKVTVKITGEREPEGYRFLGFFGLLTFALPVLTFIYVLRIGAKLNQLIKEQRAALAAWEQSNRE